CKDTITDNWVLIENQLERTDHTHLGQLLTYAAGLNAVTIVWIAERFTDEHRATLDWLNEITDGRFNFFGLEVELWRIGESPLAPKFNIASKPNDWTNTIGRAATQIQTGELTQTKQLQLEYWTAFRNYVSEHSNTLRPQSPLPQHWTNFAIGRSGFHLSALVNTAQDLIGVTLVITGPNAKPHYQALNTARPQIEQEFGCQLDWRENPDKKESGVWLRTEFDPTVKEHWPEQHKWLLATLENFRRVFGPRVRALALPEEEEGQ
ncbi:MAG TPA: DUF4268 domain-containing protein, partial [Candidatus Acidoferrum sp.]|nr:DUF4268 domain-containing protein [Candidatus Acidoferrum sp.]